MGADANTPEPKRRRGPYRTYTDSDRIDALRTLELNRGNVKKTMRDTGLPRKTIQEWRDRAMVDEAQQAVGVYVETTPTGKPKTDYAALLGEAVTEAIALLREALPRMNPRDLSIATGILIDKHLDYRDGRKSAQVNVDNRSVALTQLTDEQLARLNPGG